jgi:hypothetical protein
MENHWESGLSVLVKHALAKKVAGGLSVAAGLAEEAGGADSKLPVLY